MRPTIRTVANKFRSSLNSAPEGYVKADIATDHKPGSKAFDMDVRAFETLNELPVGTFVYWIDYRNWGAHKPFKRY